MGWFGPSKDEVWLQVSQEIGAEFVERGRYTYSRDNFHESLGGGKVSCLPQRDGKIVCGCFSADVNPESAYVILVGGVECVGGRISWQHNKGNRKVTRLGRGRVHRIVLAGRKPSSV